MSAVVGKSGLDAQAQIAKVLDASFSRIFAPAASAKTVALSRFFKPETILGEPAEVVREAARTSTPRG